MAEELNQEEENAAGEIDASAAEGKTQLEQINENVTGVSDMLKSHVEGLEKTEDPPEVSEEPFDIKSVTPEDFAKSIGGTKEEQVDYIKRLVDSCNLMPQDMIDEDSGEQIFTAEMMKSMENETSTVQGFIAGAMYALQESNERTAAKDSLMFQTLLGMSKSLADLTAVVTEQNEKLEKSMPKTEITPADEGSPLPDLEDTATTPLSEQVNLDGMNPVMTSEILTKAVKAAFPGNFSDQAELLLQATYTDWASRMPPEDALAAMPEGHRNMVTCQIPK